MQCFFFTQHQVMFSNKPKTKSEDYSGFKFGQTASSNDYLQKISKVQSMCYTF